MILAIDTSSSRGSVALGDRHGVVAERTFSGADGRDRHSTTLFPALAEILPPGQPLERIVVGLGPGSFSGIRVALAAAQGLALPGAVPVVGIASAWSVARQHAHVTRLGVFADARRGEYYCTVYAQGRLERASYLIPRAEAENEAAKMTLAVSADPLAAIAAQCAPRAADYLAADPADYLAAIDGLLEPIYLREAV